MNHARDEVKELTERPRARDWDKDFINKMIDDHQKVLDKLQDAAKNTTNADLAPRSKRRRAKFSSTSRRRRTSKTNVLKD
mgnify:CR=1 FL=1